MLLFNNVCIVNAMVIVFVDVKNFDVKKSCLSCIYLNVA